MKIKSLMKAIRFVCLPTFAVLVLMFFGFFSITKTIAFISSDSGLAAFIRVVLFLAELGLVIFMYEGYAKEEIREEALNTKAGTLTETGAIRKKYVSSNNSIHECFVGGNYRDNYHVYTTADKNIIVAERTPYQEQ